MVANEVSVNVKANIASIVTTSKADYYVWKMYNLQTIETPKKAKNKGWNQTFCWCKNARNFNQSSKPWINFNQHFRYFILFI